MKRFVIIDNRMREIEKNKLKSLKYELIELPKNEKTYEEISSHVDIYCTKIKDEMILEKSIYSYITNKIKDVHFHLGQAQISKKYPYDILYNVCYMGDFVIHNFEYTDKRVLDIIQKLNLRKIQIAQGYSNCSIAVIDENSCIVTDKKIAQLLRKYHIDVLCIEEELDIKLIKGNSYSSMKGLIGGAITRIGNDVLIFGELKKIDKNERIKQFIKSKNKKIIDFKDYDVIDYGGILEV